MTTDAEIVPIEVPDLKGEQYSIVLNRLHETLSPQTYLEIGVLEGHALKHSRCSTIAIDPNFTISDIAVINGIIKSSILHLFPMKSDEFFANYSPSAIFGRPVDMAFLDGMHLCEFLLRDFYNVERHCKKNSIIILHDCLPVETAITTRKPWGGNDRVIAPQRHGWWAGDVWRTSLLLKRRRPDLFLTVVDAAPTGLVMITNLDSESTKLKDNYREYVDEMLCFDLHKIGIEKYFSEMNVLPTSEIKQAEDISRRFWL